MFQTLRAFVGRWARVVVYSWPVSWFLERIHDSLNGCRLEYPAAFKVAETIHLQTHFCVATGLTIEAARNLAFKLLALTDPPGLHSSVIVSEPKPPKLSPGEVLAAVQQAALHRTAEAAKYRDVLTLSTAYAAALAPSAN